MNIGHQLMTQGMCLEASHHWYQRERLKAFRFRLGEQVQALQRESVAVSVTGVPEPEFLTLVMPVADIERQIEAELTRHGEWLVNHGFELDPEEEA